MVGGLDVREHPLISLGKGRFKCESILRHDTKPAKVDSLRHALDKLGTSDISLLNTRIVLCWAS